MSNTNQDSNKKENVSEESATNSKTMENQNKRKAVVLEEEPNSKMEKLKSFKNDTRIDESANSSNGFSPFLLFGFIIDPSKGYQKAYSCHICNRKFVSPQALSGNQNCQECEETLKKDVETLNKAWDDIPNGIQGIHLNNIVPYPGGCGYIYGGELKPPLLDIPQIDQDIVNEQVIMTGIDLNIDLVSEEASKNIDLNLKP